MLISSRVDESVEAHLRGGHAGEDGPLCIFLDTVEECSDFCRSI